MNLFKFPVAQRQCSFCHPSHYIVQQSELPSIKATHNCNKYECRSASSSSSSLASSVDEQRHLSATHCNKCNIVRVLHPNNQPTNTNIHTEINNCCRGKAIIIYSLCVRARVGECMWVRGCGRVRSRVQSYLSRMQSSCTIVPVASLAPPHFSTLSHKRQDFRKKSWT